MFIKISLIKNVIRLKTARKRVKLNPGWKVTKFLTEKRFVRNEYKYKKTFNHHPFKPKAKTR